MSELNSEPMSEEEIIETFKHWLEYEKANKDKINKADELIEIQQGLLDLYEQEKEKNKELAKQLNGAFDRGFISKDKIKNTGKLVKNKIDGTIGIVLREWETGQIQVLEKIQPKVINTHDSWKTLELLEEK